MRAAKDVCGIPDGERERAQAPENNQDSWRMRTGHSGDEYCQFHSVLQYDMVKANNT